MCTGIGEVIVGVADGVKANSSHSKVSYVAPDISDVSWTCAWSSGD